MNENKRLKYTTYLAGAIEAVSTKEMKSWRKEIAEKLASPDLGIYDPVDQESNKVGKESGKQVEYITGLKQGGHWDIFGEEMSKIWWGKIDTMKLDKIRLLIYLYEKARLEGNYLTDFCVDEKTYAINDNGEIKKYNELKIGDKIATYNLQTKTIEFQSILNLNIQDYNGEMYKLERKHRDYYFSPNHNVYYLWNRDSIIKTAKIKELYKQNRKINLPNYFPNNTGIDLYKDIEIKLLAWILSEGSIHIEQKRNSYKKWGSCYINISQKKGDKSEQIKNILNQLNLTYYINLYKEQETITIKAIHNNYLFDLLEIFNKNYKKTLPNKIYYTSLRQRELFIEEYLKGDGHIRDNETVIYFGSTNNLLKNFIKLFLLSGKQFKVSKQLSGFKSVTHRLNILKHDILSMTFKNKIKYNGKIWCPTTINKTWIAIRNGIPFITGNSYWGDYEATVRSDFIITYYPKDIRTVGTLNEVHTCYLFNIPIYLILPDHPKTEENSTLIDEVMKSGGEIFYSIKECCDFIKEKYKLREPKEEKIESKLEEKK